MLRTFTPNDACDPSERDAALDIALGHAIAACGDVAAFRKDGGSLHIYAGSSDPARGRPPSLFSIQECMPWLDAVPGVAESIPERTPASSGVTRLVTEKSGISVDWMERTACKDGQPHETLTYLSRCRAGEAMAHPDAFYFTPSRVSGTMGGREICGMAAGGGVAGFVESGGWMIRDDAALMLALSERVGGGPPPIGYFQGKWRDERLPDFFRPEAFRDSMFHWHLMAEKNARMPETRIFPLPCSFDLVLDGKEPPLFKTFCRQLREAADAMGYPCFLRTDLASGKREFDRCCRIARPEDIPGHVESLASFSAVVADLPILGFAVRKWIHGPSAWVDACFRGLPVRREFRVFVEGGKATHIQPCWQEESFLHGGPLPFDWKERLSAISKLGSADAEFLRKGSLAATRGLDGDWAVDWLDSGDGGWWCVDMASAERSYKH